MHPSSFGQRNMAAQIRMVDAATAIVKRYGLDPALLDGLKPQTKDRQVYAMQQREAVANILEAVCNLPVAAPVEPEKARAK